MVTFDVRPATRADLPALGVLAARLVRMHHALDPLRFFTAEGLEAGYAHWLGRELEDDDAFVLVAAPLPAPSASPSLSPSPSGSSSAVAGELLGYAYGRLEPRDWNALLDACGKLHDVWVAAEARRRGIARALVRAMMTRFAERGAPRVVLSTAWSNEAAQRLFESFGFRRTMVEMTGELERP